MTPNIAIVQVSNPYWRSFRLWLPLFLLWIPAVLLAPFLLLILLIMCLVTGVSFWNSIKVYWGILCSLPGTEVQVQVQANRIAVRIL
jgi:hypothetical protein